MLIVKLCGLTSSRISACLLCNNVATAKARYLPTRYLLTAHSNRRRAMASSVADALNKFKETNTCSQISHIPSSKFEVCFFHEANRGPVTRHVHVQCNSLQFNIHHVPLNMANMLQHLLRRYQMCDKSHLFVCLFISFFFFLPRNVFAK